MRPITQIVGHQTGHPDDTVESITRWHTTPPGPDPKHPGGLGWSHIAYHFVITPDAVLHKTLPNSAVGNHCKGDNAHSIGICFVGQGQAFPLGGGYMTVEMWCRFLRLLRDLRAAYPSIGNSMFGHREKPSGIEQAKTCPGFDMALVRRMFA